MVGKGEFREGYLRGLDGASQGRGVVGLWGCDFLGREEGGPEGVGGEGLGGAFGGEFCLGEGLVYGSWWYFERMGGDRTYVGPSHSLVAVAFGPVAVPRGGTEVRLCSIMTISINRR